MWMLRYTAARSPWGSKTAHVFESLSRPSLSSAIEPPTSVIPYLAAHPAIAANVSPLSSVSAISRRKSGAPTPFHFSGRTTTSAPVAAARPTSLSMRSRLSALAAEALSCTQATRRRSAMLLRIAWERERPRRDPRGSAHDRARRRFAEGVAAEPRRHALPPPAGLPRDPRAAGGPARDPGRAPRGLAPRDRGADRPRGRVPPRGVLPGGGRGGGRGGRRRVLAPARGRLRRGTGGRRAGGHGLRRGRVHGDRPPAARSGVARYRGARI